MRRVGYLTLEITSDHRECPAGKVAQSVRQIGVVTLDNGIEAERTILSENNLAQQKVAQRIGT